MSVVKDTIDSLQKELQAAREERDSADRYSKRLEKSAADDLDAIKHWKARAESAESTLVLADALRDAVEKVWNGSVDVRQALDNYDTARRSGGGGAGGAGSTCGFCGLPWDEQADPLSCPKSPDGYHTFQTAPEPSTCPSCGSGDPAKDVVPPDAPDAGGCTVPRTVERADHLPTGTLTHYGRAPLFCCPDPFHTPTPEQEASDG